VRTLVGCPASGKAGFQLDNFRVDSEMAAGIENLFLSGRLTMADGFVDVGPRATRVELPVPSTGLQNGGVLMTGATTVATVFYNGGSDAPAISIAPR
jgi:hypothetical protein